jgi:hypothetical protein
MGTLPPHPTSDARQWARDFALVGLIAGLAAPLWYIREQFWGPAEAITGAVIMVFGLVLGRLSAWVFSGRARRWPKVAFLPLGALVGMVSGFVTNSVVLAVWICAPARHMTPHETLHEFVEHLAYFMSPAVTLGSITAAQMTWFWLAYAYKRVNGLSVRGLMVLGCLSTAALGVVYPFLVEPIAELMGVSHHPF